MHKPKLLVLTSTFPRFKNDNEPPFVYELSRRLTNEFQITVLAPHAPGIKVCERMSGMLVVRYRYFFGRFEKLAYESGILTKLKQSYFYYLLVPFFFLGQSIALWRLHRRYRFDVIHAHWIFPQGLIAVIIAQLFRIRPRILITSHGGDLFGLQGKLLKAMMRRVINKAQALTVVSEAMRDYAVQRLGIAKEKVWVASMGVDTRCCFTPPVDEARGSDTLLFVGRLVEKKGVEYLLDAMPEIIRKKPECRLWIVGYGALEEALKVQAERLAIQNKVFFLGKTENSKLPQFYRQATMLVAPFVVAQGGDQEGLGLVLVESLACGCPVVASDLPAVRDVIIHRDTGILVPERDHIKLAKAIVELLTDCVERAKLANNGMQYVRQNYDWGGVADRYSKMLMRM